VDCTSDERERHRTQEKRPYDTPSEHSSSQVPEGCEAREPWTIERKHDHVAVVTTNTNKVNAQNPAFFGDLHAAFDRLEAELPSAPRRSAARLRHIMIFNDCHRARRRTALF
jgi:hypothetical protein